MACIDKMESENSTKVFEKYCIECAPTAVYYIPDFVTAKEESRLWQCIYTAPKPKWTVLSHRRLQNWGGLPHSKGMVPEPLPQWLSQYTDRVSALGMFGDSRTANHVLVNEYTAGQGIMAHVDGPLFYPTISTLNIGGHTLLNLYSLPEECGGDTKSLTERFLGSLLLEPRSLLILQQDAYNTTLHDIADTDTDLVCRDRVLNWDQTALGCWAMRSSLLGANGKHSAGGGKGVSNDDIRVEKKSNLGPDCYLDLSCASAEERDRRTDIHPDTGPSFYNDLSNKIYMNVGALQENSKYDTVENILASGSIERNAIEIRNGDQDCDPILSGLHERRLTNFVNYLEQFNDRTNSFEISNKASKTVGWCSKTISDSSPVVNETVGNSVATGSVMQPRDAMYALEVKLARCDDALVSEAAPYSDESESSVSLNLLCDTSDKLTVNRCSLDNETSIDSTLTAENDHQQLNTISDSRIFVDDSSLKTPKVRRCVSSQLVPKEVCQSLAGPGHGSCTAPAAQAVTVAGKECFLLPRGTRISLTIRHVPKVIKTKIFLGRR